MFVFCLYGRCNIALLLVLPLYTLEFGPSLPFDCPPRQFIGYDAKNIKKSKHKATPNVFCFLHSNPPHVCRHLAKSELH